jgi:mono/diheme cytochrome c family protein
MWVIAEHTFGMLYCLRSVVPARPSSFPPFSLNIMDHILRNIFALTIVLFALAHPAALRADDALLADDANSVAEFQKTVAPLFKKLCVECHGARKPAAEFRIDTLSPDLIKSDNAEAWHDVLDKVNLGEMPPKKATQPNVDERRIITAWITSALSKAAAAKDYARGRVIMRRLTRYEYQNTMRDLLGVELDFSKNLPPEPQSADGFLNNAATLEMSPIQIETYLQAARAAMRVVIVSGEKPQTFHMSATKTARGKLPRGTVAGHAPVNPEYAIDVKKFPRQGEFELRIRAYSIVPADRGFPRIRVQLGHQPGIIHVPRKLVGESDVLGTKEAPQTLIFRGRMEDFPQPGDVPFGNVNFEGMLGLVDFLDADGRELRYADKAYVALPPKPKKNQKVKPKNQPAPVVDASRLDIVIESVEFESPVGQEWPPAHHAQVLFKSENSTNEKRYVREVLERFMTRAYRRPVTSAEVETTARLFEQVRAHTQTFEQAVRETLASVLVSPHFLYIVETRTSDTKDAQDSKQATLKQPRKPERLTEFELASRLSYFLWSSMPDARLFELAQSGTLRKNLDSEVPRLLKDSRSTEFVDRFANQWFDLDALDRVAVNPEFYPDFDNRLKADMRRETQAMLHEILHKDLSTLDLIDSDWTMANRNLAQHYGLLKNNATGPRSMAFERVALSKDDRRGGVLGHAGVLLGNSNGEASHPIKRAVWILDRLLDSPPAPPPPDVPELNEQSTESAGLSLKEQLAAHRQKAACANCHIGIDPWGIPLENFDAIGRWRTEFKLPSKPERSARRGKNGRQARTKTPKNSPAATKSKVSNQVAPKLVDSKSQLPDGTQLDGFDDLKQYLIANRQELFARAVVKRLTAYALGRSLDEGDLDTVQKLQLHLIKSEYRLKSLIVALVKSDAFQTK